MQHSADAIIDSNHGGRDADVVKAPAVGARAVCIGWPNLWGLGAIGQPGVERVLELLRIETRAAMPQCGVRAIQELIALLCVE